VTHDLGWWLVGMPVVDLFALIELFRYYGFGCTQILPGRGDPPSTILGIRKLETLGYPMVRPHPSVFPRFDTVP